eukprot:3951686-Prorocentrum_lima.AAC.1
MSLQGRTKPRLPPAPPPWLLAPARLRLVVTALRPSRRLAASGRRPRRPPLCRAAPRRKREARRCSFASAVS